VIEATYDQRSFDLARYRPDPVDDLVAAFIQTGADPAALTEQDCYTLLTFSRRQAVQALRDHDADSARRGVTALTLIDRDKIDWRDLSVDFPLFAAVETGSSLDQVVDHAVARSVPRTAEVFDAARKRTPSLAGCRLLPVRTQYGLGFVDVTESYEPRSGLAERAVGLADAIDAEGTYEARNLTTSRLPLIWFDGKNGHVRNASCIALHAERVGAPPWSHSLLIFLAQLKNAREATKLLGQLRDASSPRRPRVGLTDDHRLLAIIGGSSQTDQESLETELSLARFTDLYSRIS